MIHKVNDIFYITHKALCDILTRGDDELSRDSMELKATVANNKSDFEQVSKLGSPPNLFVGDSPFYLQPNRSVNDKVYTHTLHSRTETLTHHSNLCQHRQNHITRSCQPHSQSASH